MSHSKKTDFQRNKLAQAISLLLQLSMPHFVAADTYEVSNPIDDGTGLMLGSLSAAILSANENPGSDVIRLNTDVKVTGVMKRLVDSDVNIESDSIRRTIDGDNRFRPLFIKSGLVTISRLNIINGLAKGGGADNTGAGGGLGGGLFIYDGTVNLEFVDFFNNVAQSGLVVNHRYSAGGGMYGQGHPHGGGLFANNVYGGYGNYRDIDPLFGEGGQGFSLINQDGGFGGGGGYYYNSNGNGGKGGFGGGGGFGYDGNGGDGGFGAGGGGVEYVINQQGQPGYGGHGLEAAGMGGAVFLRTGNLNLENVRFLNNHARAIGEAKGLGGALFLLHTTVNSNGNNQGMPTSLGHVIGCSVNFDGNTATGDSGISNNNDDLFDLSDLYNVSGDCEQELEVSGNSYVISNGSMTVDATSGTDFGGIDIHSQSDQIFEIKNMGGMDLNLSGEPIVEIVGINPLSFSINELPTRVIEPGQSDEFHLIFNPSTVGLKTATVHIANNDVDEYDFNFKVHGVALGAEITVSNSGINIVNGDSTPMLSNGTYFGASSGEQSFTIFNDGIVPLELVGSSPIRILGDDADYFSISAQPSSQIIAVGESTQFTVSYSASQPGFKKVKLNIRSNDVNDGSFGFMIAGGKDVGDFVVDQSEDDGTGLVPNTLSWSILQANLSPGPQIITLENDVKITGVMKRLVDSDVTIKSSGRIVDIDGDNRYRPLFIKSGQVVITRLNFIDGKAKGGGKSHSSTWHDGSGGAGMGGSVFMYDGQVMLSGVKFFSSKASASNTSVNGKSGGGMFYDGERDEHGGGLFEETTSNCSYGGYGRYQNNDPNFGMGGGRFPCSSQAGFGGGGSYDYTYEGGSAVGGNGGFGGGGGGAYSYYYSNTPGNGGFGGGGGVPGYGASGIGAAMGGAIFVRSGQLEMSHVQMLDNEASSRGDSKGLGGAIFIIHTLENPNGNNQGMPTVLPVVSGCNMTFQNNVAGDDVGTVFNNNDIFDLAGRYTDLDECEVELEFDLIYESGFE
ncbi:MAG: choice-of-anchor D domain-containing protein [Marinicella sp.]